VFLTFVVFMYFLSFFLSGQSFLCPRLKVTNYSVHLKKKDKKYIKTTKVKNTKKVTDQFFCCEAKTKL